MKANQDDSYKRTDDKHWVNFIQINDIYISNKKTVIFSISDKAYTNYIAPIITEYLSNNHITLDRHIKQIRSGRSQRNVIQYRSFYKKTKFCSL